MRTIAKYCVLQNVKNRIENNFQRKLPFFCVFFCDLYAFLSTEIPPLVVGSCVVTFGFAKEAANSRYGAIKGHLDVVSSTDILPPAVGGCEVTFGFAWKAASLEAIGMKKTPNIRKKFMNANNDHCLFYQNVESVLSRTFLKLFHLALYWMTKVPTVVFIDQMISPTSSFGEFCLVWNLFLRKIDRVNGRSKRQISMAK